jgi:hypothetical protein
VEVVKAIVRRRGKALHYLAGSPKESWGDLSVALDWRIVARTIDELRGDHHENLHRIICGLRLERPTQRISLRRAIHAKNSTVNEIAERSLMRRKAPFQQDVTFVAPKSQQSSWATFLQLSHTRTLKRSKTK